MRRNRANTNTEYQNQISGGSASASKGNGSSVEEDGDSSSSSGTAEPISSGNPSVSHSPVHGEYTLTLSTYSRLMYRPRCRWPSTLWCQDRYNTHHRTERSCHSQARHVSDLFTQHLFLTVTPHHMTQNSPDSEKLTKQGVRVLSPSQIGKYIHLPSRPPTDNLAM